MFIFTYLLVSVYLSGSLSQSQASCWSLWSEKTSPVLLRRITPFISASLFPNTSIDVSMPRISSVSSYIFFYDTLSIFLCNTKREYLVTLMVFLICLNFIVECPLYRKALHWYGTQIRYFCIYIHFIFEIVLKCIFAFMSFRVIKHCK